MRDSKALRQARENEPDPYRRRFAVRGWNVAVTVCEEHRLFRALPEFRGWTKDRHQRMADEYATLSRVTDQMYGALTTMMVCTYGDGNGNLISGCYRDHFPHAVKDDLRHLAHTATDYRSRSSAHWRAAGRTMQTWRDMWQQLNGNQSS
jgi:hypothetical protein